MTSFQRARVVLGQRLRELRQDARLTGRELAASQGWHPAKVSRIEAGKQTPADADVEAWATACGAPKAVGDLVAALRGLDGHYLEHRRRYRGGRATPQLALREREASCSVVRNFEAAVIPGLLQTPDYARFMLSPGVKYGGPPDDVDEAVAARMARQQIMYRHEPKVHIVMTEAPLHYRLCPREVMAGQLDRLLAAATMQTFCVGVIPFTADRAMEPPAHGFWIYDEDEVQVETLTASLTLCEPSEITAYLELFDHYATAAVYGAEARAIITRVLAELVTSMD